MQEIDGGATYQAEPIPARESTSFGAIDDAEDLVIQPDGKIVAVDSAQNGNAGGLAIVRIIP